ncbi:MAG TPA: TA system VapC family ribonuclease toxin [Terriglobia bacterium]|nr:TA system VapC family ribonuclease toxin [Terriglobia bacterium]
MRHLCDSNVILAAVVAAHPHHDAALDWIAGFGAQDTVTLCRQTQMSLLRLLTTEAVMQDEVQTNANAASLLNQLMADPRFEFVDREPPDFQSSWLGMAGLRSASPKLWMDAYLAAFARGHSLRFVTFDSGFASFRKAGVDVLILQ